MYYVDGSPIIADFCVGHSASARCAAKANWRTILVAGLNSGGRGYYALDVTDPTTPKALWEFTSSSTCLTDTDISSGAHYADCHVGYSFGNPQITKRASDERWVVLVTSGYNNVSPGDGKGYLYVLDAATGQILQRIGTGEGCDGSSSTPPCTAGTVDPSGLNRINNWLDNGMFNNKTQYVYGGDLWGNVWRFDLNANSAFKLAILKDAAGVAQPITTKPELGEVSSSKVVYIATGRMLGATDLTSTQRQTVYAIKDPISATQTTINSPRATAGFVSQTLTDNSATTRTATANTVDLTTGLGWYANLPDGGDSTTPASPSERANVDPELQLGSLIVPTNVPSSDTCVAGGYGWVNTFDAKTGSFVAGSNGIVGQKVSASVIVGINVIQLPSGTVKAIVTTADNQQTTVPPPFAPSSVVGRRVSWRELVVE
jgi:type IV pilus assembly protein PilY1